MSTIPRDPIDAAVGNIAPVVSSVRWNHDALVKEFESAAETLGVARPSTAELYTMCGQAAEVTDELFSGDWTVEIRVDPEIRDDLYFVFKACAAGSVDDLAARDGQWHRRLLPIGCKWPGLFRLSIDAQ